MARGARGLGTSVDVSSADVAVSRLLNNVSNASLAGYLETAASNWFVARAHDRFANSGDGASGRWAPLAASTVDIRRNLGFTPGTGIGEINVRTGTLREWMTNPQTTTVHDGLGVSMAWPEADPGDREIQRRLAQAAGKGRGPARPVIAYDATDLSYLLSTLTGWISGDKR